MVGNDQLEGRLFELGAAAFIFGVVALLIGVILTVFGEDYTWRVFAPGVLLLLASGVFFRLLKLAEDSRCQTPTKRSPRTR